MSTRRLPAEWEPQAAILLTWPHPATDWAPELPEVEAVYRRIADLIARRQALLVVCFDEAHREHVGAQLAAAGVPPTAVRLAVAPGNDTWARDHGPLTVLDASGGARLLDFRFNGWGGKYPAELDDRITARLYADGWLGAGPLERSSLVLEGGAIDTDGAGSLLAVRRTLVDPARNPGWSQSAIEAELRERLGVRRCLWLAHGQLDGDDTDGHIDTLARFCTPDTICHVSAHPAASRAEHDALGAMLGELRTLRRADGSPYRLLALPAPRPITGADGIALPGGYANFLIINGAVLVPTYDDPADDIAITRLAAVFPGRVMEAVDCRALIRQGGSLHCITMQLPAALSPAPADPV